MIKFRLKKESLITYSPSSYIDIFNINVYNDYNDSVIPFTSIQCEYHYKKDIITYTISCCSLKTNKIMMDMFGDTHLFFNNRSSFRKAIKKIIEKYYEEYLHISN